MFSTRTARRCTSFRCECLGIDPERGAVSFPAAGGVWTFHCAAHRLASELCIAGDDPLLSRTRHRRPHRDSLRADDAWGVVRLWVGGFQFSRTEKLVVVG